jgi:hypothetical protein
MKGIRMTNMTYNIKVVNQIIKKETNKLKQEHKLNDKLVSTINMVMTNLLASLKTDCYLNYSRDLAKAIPAKRYNKKQISTRYVIKAIDLLENNGYLYNYKAERQVPLEHIENQQFVCSYVKPTDKFISLFKEDEDAEIALLSNIVDNETVLLKDDGILLDYRDNDLTNYSRLCLKYYNQAVSKTKVSLDEKNYNCTLVRIFNKEIGSTGRLYRSAVQNIWAEDRKRITIDDEETIEIDYSCLHLRMLLAMYGRYEELCLHQDLYSLCLTEDELSNKINRNVIKASFNKMINCSSKKVTLAVIQQHLNLNKGSDFKTATEVLNRILETFSFLPLPVILWQSKPMAYSLQRMDSDIALEIITTLAQEGIVVLPVHDSFVTQTKHKMALQQKMADVYKQYMKLNNVPDYRVCIPVKVIYKDREFTHYLY